MRVGSRLRSCSSPVAHETTPRRSRVTPDAVPDPRFGQQRARVTSRGSCFVGEVVDSSAPKEPNLRRPIRSPEGSLNQRGRSLEDEDVQPLVDRVRAPCSCRRGRRASRTIRSLSFSLEPVKENVRGGRSILRTPLISLSYLTCFFSSGAATGRLVLPIGTSRWLRTVPAAGVIDRSITVGPGPARNSASRLRCCMRTRSIQ